MSLDQICVVDDEVPVLEGHELDYFAQGNGGYLCIAVFVPQPGDYNNAQVYAGKPESMGRKHLYEGKKEDYLVTLTLSCFPDEVPNGIRTKLVYSMYGEGTYDVGGQMTELSMISQPLVHQVVSWTKGIYERIKNQV